MSTLAMSKENQSICDSFDLYEYGSSYLITMRDGYRFIGSNLEKNHLGELHAIGAKIELLSELGA
jgi:hypothetical protein